MAPIQQFGKLTQRKKALLLESEMNRLVLRLELEKFRNSTARLDSTFSTVRRFGPWLLPLVSAVGLFAGRRARKGAAAGGWLSVAIRLLPAILQLRRTKAATQTED
jgi:hypothetical protein